MKCMFLRSVVTTDRTVNPFGVKTLASSTPKTKNLPKVLMFRKVENLFFYKHVGAVS
jgi:hypothetical protein